MLDSSRSSIPIPERFWDVRYSADRFPGALGVTGVDGGANCQQYAFALLRHHGFALPDFRSSDLWEDVEHTAVADRMEPFDLVMVHNNPHSWGAHVGLCVGEELVLHLSKQIGAPAIETLEDMQQRDEYRYLIGFKRLLRRAGAGAGRPTR